MTNVITAQEIKRRGISAVDEALRHGPVHVIQRNRPRYVILSEDGYRRLLEGRESQRRLWDRLLADTPRTGRSAQAIDHDLAAERESWDR